MVCGRWTAVSRFSQQRARQNRRRAAFAPAGPRAIAPALGRGRSRRGHIAVATDPDGCRDRRALCCGGRMTSRRFPPPWPAPDSTLRTAIPIKSPLCRCVCIPAPLSVLSNRACRHPPSDHRPGRIGFMKSSTMASASWRAVTARVSGSSPVTVTISRHGFRSPLQQSQHSQRGRS
jgi:hypothetical protein